MTPVLWAATGVIQPEATKPDTAAPASASRRFVSMLIIVLRRSFNATIGGDDYHDHRKRTLLRPPRERPRGRCAAEQRDELAAFHLLLQVSFTKLYRGDTRRQMPGPSFRPAGDNRYGGRCLMIAASTVPQPMRQPAAAP